MDLRRAECAAFVVYANDVGDGWAEPCVLPGALRGAAFRARPLAARPGDAALAGLVGGEYAAAPVDAALCPGYAYYIVRAHHLRCDAPFNALAAGLAGQPIYGDAVFVRARNVHG